ncbi:MAG: hypothetical protein ACRD4L_00925, partial [Pyrinomonadaceae bacterium]
MARRWRLIESLINVLSPISVISRAPRLSRLNPISVFTTKQANYAKDKIKAFGLRPAPIISDNY